MQTDVNEFNVFSALIFPVLKTWLFGQVVYVLPISLFGLKLFITKV